MIKANLIATRAVREHRAIQKIQELELLAKFLQPIESVLEIGSYFGGTLWFWHYLGATRIYSIDDFSGVAIADHPKIVFPPDILVLGANSHFEKTLEVCKKTIKAVDLIFIDGDHSYEGVKQDYEMYSSLAKKYIVFHDIIPHGDTGVDKLWREIKMGRKYEFKAGEMTWGGIGCIRLA